jgi:hypothetical protein
LAPGWLDPYIVGHYKLEVVNVVFNGVGMSGPVVLPHHTVNIVATVGPPGTVAVPGKWSAALVLHCSRTIASCPHVSQVLTTPPARTSCIPTMALTSDTLEICARALGISEPYCMGRHVRLLFTLMARDPQRVAGRVAARSPPHREARSGAIGDAVL